MRWIALLLLCSGCASAQPRLVVSVEHKLGADTTVKVSYELTR